MIITIVCDVLGQENNGTTIAAMNLIRYLESQNYTVKILCSQQENPDNNFYMVESRDFWIFNDYVKKNGVSLAKPDEDIIAKAIAVFFTSFPFLIIVFPLSLIHLTI